MRFIKLGENILKSCHHTTFFTILDILRGKKGIRQSWTLTNNGKKKRELLNQDWLSAIVLFLLTLVWIEAAPEWYSWYAIERNGAWMKWLYSFLEYHCFVSILLSVGIIYLAYCWMIRIWIDNDCRPYRFSVVGGLLIGLYWKSNVVYADILCGFDYRMLLSCLSTIALLILIFKPLKSKVATHGGVSHNKEKVENLIGHKNLQGFSHDNTASQSAPDSLKKYASTIARRLMATKIGEQSYAIGITGEWGVGKTTFLNLLKNRMAEKAEIVEFNPWMCRSPEQVTNDFFASLRHQLAPKHSTLSKSLKEYAKSINNLTLTPHSIPGIELSLPIRENSLYKKKLDLSGKFSRLSRPVVVIIDDVDRLEREEVFEVLRLIRNTADLHNTIYIVAYDKEYVTTILEEKNIKDAESYLEKIFQVEVHLPKVDDYLIWETLYNDLNCQDQFDGKFTKYLFVQFNYNERSLILRVLNNYRRVKRFARLYTLNVDYLMGQCKGEIKLLDLFWLEILQTYDKKTYDKIANEPYCLLYYEKGTFNLKKGILQSSQGNEDKIYKGDVFWKDETPKILERMFGQCSKNGAGSKSICYPENYDKYFTLYVSPYKLSFEELKSLLTEENDPEKIVNQWLDRKKYISSIVYQLSHVQIEAISDNLMKNYLHGVLFFALKTVSTPIHQFATIKKMLQANKYEYANRQSFAHDNVLTWFDKELKNEKNLLNLSGLLNRLYLPKTYDQDNHVIDLDPLVISNNEIEEFLIACMQTYLDNHPESSALDLLKEETTLFSLFKNCCLNTDANIITNDGYGYSYKQVAFKMVINYFEKKEDKPTSKQYEELYTSLYSQETPAFTSAEEESAYWDCIDGVPEHQMKKTFGDSYYNNLEEFKNKCFVTE